MGVKVGVGTGVDVGVGAGVGVACEHAASARSIRDRKRSVRKAWLLRTRVAGSVALGQGVV